VAAAGAASIALATAVAPSPSSADAEVSAPAVGEGIATIVQPGAGEVFDMTPAERFTWKALGAETGGAFDAFEAAMQPGFPGPPEHIHDEADELFYVLEGSMRLKVGTEIVTAEAGAFAYVPRGTPHSWLNIHAGVSRMLTLFVPGGMRGFFEEASAVHQADPPDLEALGAIAARFATRVVGPPLTL